MKIKNLYSSVACNCTTSCADWGINNLIVFGAQNATVVLNPKYNGNTAKILYTYVHHKKKVNVVRWLNSSNSQEHYILSGADDGLVIFSNVTNMDEPSYIEIEGHNSGVYAIDGFHREKYWILASAAADSTIKLWITDSKTRFECIETILLNGGYCLSLRLFMHCKTDSIFLAFGSDDKTISLWVQKKANNRNIEQSFKSICKLTGHENWIRGLDFTIDGNDILLASCSQDNFIRLWRISPRTKSEMKSNGTGISKLEGEQTNGLRMEENIYKFNNTWCVISLESVLCGHDGWVYSVHWNKTKEQGLRLLSASIDKTLIIWELTADGLWMEKVREGEVGGSSLGFYGGKFSNDGKSIMGHSYQGVLYIWNQSEKFENLWVLNASIGGHFNEVRDIEWDKDGKFLISVSADQTTRIHAPITQENKNLETCWQEIARPQIHGYDMNALAILSRYTFASSGEEKIVRVFQAPVQFVNLIKQLLEHTESDMYREPLKILPKSALVPSLGLSNKAVFNIQESESDKEVLLQKYSSHIKFDTTQLEETIMENSLWPEVQKLYGHGFEISTLAASCDGQILASACRAKNEEHAQIILWNAKSWKQIQKLKFHQLTVTQMRFSPCGRYLLSVSRDRSWALFEKSNLNEDLYSFELRSSTDKTNCIHKRILWSCDWSHDSKYFITSSRDGKVVIWALNDSKETKTNVLKQLQPFEVLDIKNKSITAVAFGTKSFNMNNYIVALGSESGDIQIYKFDTKLTHILSFDQSQSHHMAVRRLQFQPQSKAIDQLILASCGNDNFVKIFKLIL